MTLASPPTGREMLVIPAEPAHAAGIETLQAVVYDDDPYEWDDMITRPQALHHLELFPEGQFVAVDSVTGEVVGMTVSMRIDHDISEPFLESWYATTGNGWLTPHVPDGAWMYGVETAVREDYRGRGVGSKLMDARYAVVRALNLRGMIAGSAIDNYEEVAHLSPQAYVEAVRAGRHVDANLSKQLHKGFRAHNVIPNFLIDSGEGNMGYGVAIVWDNPDYVPGRAPATPVDLPRYRFKLR